MSKLSALMWQNKKPSLGGFVLSGHSGGGPRAMTATTKKSSKPSKQTKPSAPAKTNLRSRCSGQELVLMDAINFRGGKSNEYTTVKNFVEARIHEDADALGIRIPMRRIISSSASASAARLMATGSRATAANQRTGLLLLLVHAVEQGHQRQARRRGQRGFDRGPSCGTGEELHRHRGSRCHAWSN